MTIPPAGQQPPPGNQPGSGGFGPPSGYGYPGPPPSGGGAPSGGFGPPGQPPGGQGGFGPPGPPAGGGHGGFGPPGPPGPPSGGWQQPPSGGGGNRKAVIIALVSVVVAGALIIGGAFLFTGGDGDKEDDAKNSQSPTPASESPTPSESETDPGEETDEPWVDPSESPSGIPSFSFDPEALQPTPTSGPQPAYQLRVGNCFDMSEEREGYNEKVDCSKSHDGEVVHREKLKDKEYASDAAIRTEADTVCKSKLQSKANKQPAGAKFRTLAQFPKKRGYDTGMRTVTCSLVAQEAQKLDSKLR